MKKHLSNEAHRFYVRQYRKFFKRLLKHQERKESDNTETEFYSPVYAAYHGCVNAMEVLHELLIEEKKRERIPFFRQKKRNN